MNLSTSELIYGLLACALALGIGALLGKKQAQTYQVSNSTCDQGHLPPVNHVDYGDMRFLHLGTPWVQGSMKISQPFHIHLEYVQRMMGWLLFADLDQVHHLKCMQLGLGAAALTKFCHIQLGMSTTAVELNPQVIATCRQWFNLPNDNPKLQVLQADAAEIASQMRWHGTIDVLQVDLYDQEAAYPVLDNEAFYGDCKKLLTSSGCMAINLYGRDANLENSIKKIANVFGKRTLWAFKPTPAGNTVVLAFQNPRVFDKATLHTQAKMIRARWPLPTEKWAKTLAPLFT